MSSVRKKISNKGFTMIELLAAVTILGIVMLVAIKGVTGLIQRAKNERVIQQEKTLSLAAESYIQANSRLKPKTIGESRLIEVKALKKANYLKEDIVNDKGESCMENSVVRVYKLSKTEYTYYPALYCGSETRPAEVTPPTPSISAYFTDATLKNKNSGGTLTLSDVSKARLVIDMNGGTTAGGEKIAVDGYSYSIDASDTTGRRTVYDSGSLSANRKTSLSVSFDLNDYIDLSGRTYFYVKVSVTNVYGGVKTYDYGIDTPSAGGIYKDNTDPVCVSVQNQAGDGEWINKYSPVKERTITVSCDDVDGSGCVRDTFSKTWPNKNQQSTDNGFITIKDNAGNRKNCNVKVNVDIVSPVINMSIYQRTKNGGASTTKLRVKDGDSYTYKISADSSNDYTKVINAADFELANDSGWIGSDVPYGIAFKLEISDDFRLASWSWETNKPQLESTDDPLFNTVSSEYADAKSYDYLKKKPGEIVTVDGNRTNNSIVVAFSESGARKGVLTVKDLAGNESQIVIYTNYSHTTPCISNPSNPWGPCHNQVSSSLEFFKYREPDVALPGDPYNFKTATTDRDKWSTTSVIAKPPASVVDEVKKINGLYFEYVVEIENKTTSDYGKKNPFISNPDYNGTGYNFDNSGGTTTTNGKNTIIVRICDQAHNCIESEKYNVWIDTVPPKCTVSSRWYDGNTYTSNNSTAYNDGHWLKKNLNARIIAECSDSANLFTTSNCTNDTKSFYTDYKESIFITNGGAKGAGNGGYVEDVAGNRTDCRSDVTVKIDHKDPKCVVTAIKGTSSYNGSWINDANIGGGVDVTTTASDPNENGVNSGVKLYRVSGASKYEIANPKTQNYRSNINTDNATSIGDGGTVIAIDGAGNQVTCGKKAVKIDRDAPTCSPDGVSSTWRNPKSVTITYNCNDHGGSGCNMSSTYKKYTTNTKQDSVQLVDVAGNESTCKYDVYLDNVAPTCGTKSGEQTSSSPGPRKVTVNCNDNETNHSGCSSPSFTHTFTAEGKTGKITISDNAGNETDCTVNINIVNNPPKVCPTVEDKNTNTTRLATDEELFGTAINETPRKFSSSRSVSYKHFHRGDSGSVNVYYYLNVSNTEYIYNYLPLNPNKAVTSKPPASYTYSSLDYNSNSSSKPLAFGFRADWSDYRWCDHNCSGARFCYARVCNTDACGDFLGWTAEAMNNYIGSSSCDFARCWCSCNYADADWFN